MPFQNNHRFRHSQIPHAGSDSHHNREVRMEERTIDGESNGNSNTSGSGKDVLSFRNLHTPEDIAIQEAENLRRALGIKRPMTGAVLEVVNLALGNNQLRFIARENALVKISGLKINKEGFCRAKREEGNTFDFLLNGQLLLIRNDTKLTEVFWKPLRFRKESSSHSEGSNYKEIVPNAEEVNRINYFDQQSRFLDNLRAISSSVDPKTTVSLLKAFIKQTEKVRSRWYSATQYYREQAMIDQQESLLVSDQFNSAANQLQLDFSARWAEVGAKLDELRLTFRHGIGLYPHPQTVKSVTVAGGPKLIETIYQYFCENTILGRCLDMKDFEGQVIESLGKLSKPRHVNQYLNHHSGNH